VGGRGSKEAKESADRVLPQPTVPSLSPVALRVKRETPGGEKRPSLIETAILGQLFQLN